MEDSTNQSDYEPDEAEKVLRFTELLRDASGGFYLKCVAQGTGFAAAPQKSLHTYVTEFIEDAIGCSGRHEPLLRTLAEQVILAHHTIGRLQNEGPAVQGSRDASNQFAVGDQSYRRTPPTHKGLG